MLNRSKTKKYILGMWKQLRYGHEINRVSKEYLDELDARIRILIIKEIKSHPSKGKTFNP